MTQPILSIDEDTNASSPKAIANLLPCRVHHDGPIDPIDTYWKPTTSEDGTKNAYFRGRKLQGKTVALPEQYRGVVMERQETKQQSKPEGMQDDDDELPQEIASMKVTAGFDKMVVWGHESVATAEADPYIRSIEEWLQVADKIHAYEEPESKTQK